VEGADHAALEDRHLLDAAHVDHSLAKGAIYAV
jgi:hypothetical protein